MGESNLKQNIYFTYVPRKCGFTDNLERFDVCYRLGISLGYEYAHTPLNTPRTSSRIDDFMGFSDYFPIKTEDVLHEDAQVVKIDLFSLFKDNDFNSLAYLQNFIRGIISDSDKANKDIAVIEFCISKRNLIPREPFVVEILKTLLMGQPSSSQLNYRSIFFQARSRSSYKSLYTPNKSNLLVHIRLGDTATIKTPWGTYIPLEKLKRKQTNQYEFFDRDSIESRSMDVAVFYDFLKRFFAYFGEPNYSLIVSSDGYKRGFRKIYRNQEFLELTGNQIQKLKVAEKSYNQKAFSVLDNFEDCQCLVGETDKNLFDFIHSILTADIILIGTQQRMIPKLMNFYSDEDHHPILIFLHTSENLPIIEGLDIIPSKCLFINIENINYEDVFENLSQIFIMNGI